MDIQIARTNMLKQQLRTSGIVDDALLAVINSIAREDFVPAAFYNVAYADMNIPLAHNQCMLSPTQEAKILQAVAIQPHERVLEIGTGTGYLTALLAKLAEHVTTVDIIPEFIELATHNLAKQNIENVALHVGNGAVGWDKHKQFDVIIISGAVPFIAQAFEQQLKKQGRLFAFVGEAPAMEAFLVKRTAAEQWQYDDLFETCVLPLLEAPQRAAFEF